MTSKPESQRGSPEREPSVKLKASIDTSCLTTESHETHHDLFSLTKIGEHLVCLVLDCWFAFISHIKNSKIENNKNIFVGRMC